MIPMTYSMFCGDSGSNKFTHMYIRVLAGKLNAGIGNA